MITTTLKTRLLIFMSSSLTLSRLRSKTHTRTHSRMHALTHTVVYCLFRNRVVLLKLEEEFLTYVTDPKRYIGLSSHENMTFDPTSVCAWKEGGLGLYIYMYNWKKQFAFNQQLTNFLSLIQDWPPETPPMGLLSPHARSPSSCLLWPRTQRRPHRQVVCSCLQGTTDSSVSVFFCCSHCSGTP